MASISVKACDFHGALKVIVPTAQRSDGPSSHALSTKVQPLLAPQFDALLSSVSFLFAPAWRAICKAQKELASVLAELESKHARMESCLEALFKEIGWNYQESFLSLDGSSRYATNSCGAGDGHPATPERPSGPNVALPHPPSKSRLKPSDFSSVLQMNRNHDVSALVRRDQPPGDSQLHTQFRLSAASQESMRSASSSLPDLFGQLCTSSQPSSLEEVYFDLEDAAALEGNVGEAESILVEGDSSKADQRPTETSVVAAFAHPTEGTDATGGSVSGPPSQDTQTEEGVSSQNTEVALPAPSTAVPSGGFLSFSSHPHALPPSHRPRLMLCGEAGMGQSGHLAPALLHALEDLPVKVLDLAALFSVSSKTPEEACTQVCTLLNSRV